MTPKTFEALRDELRAILSPVEGWLIHHGVLENTNDPGRAYVTFGFSQDDSKWPPEIRANLIRWLADHGSPSDGHAYQGNNEDPCGYLMSIYIPSVSIRHPTPLETAIAKIKRFTPEEKAAIAAYNGRPL